MYTIQSVYARHALQFDPAYTRKDNNGVPLEIHHGWKIRFTPYGKRRDPSTGETIAGIKADGLSAHFFARQGRALGTLDLASEAERMRTTGYPDMTEEKLLRWFLDKHGVSRGVEWNIYDQNGNLVPDEELERGVKPRTEADKWAKGDYGNDAEFIVESESLPNGLRCTACDKDALPGPMAGHRRSQKHWRNVEAAQAKIAAV